VKVPKARTTAYSQKFASEAEDRGKTPTTGRKRFWHRTATDCCDRKTNGKL